MATHSSILAWRTHGRRSLVGYSPQGLKESNTTEQLHRGGGNAPYCTNRQRIFLTHPGSSDSVVTTTLREKGRGERGRKERREGRKKSKDIHGKFIWGDVHQSVDRIPSVSESPNVLHKQILTSGIWESELSQVSQRNLTH